jgi:hypothetical protein
MYVCLNEDHNHMAYGRKPDSLADEENKSVVHQIDVWQ